MSTTNPTTITAFTPSPSLPLPPLPHPPSPSLPPPPSRCSGDIPFLTPDDYEKHLVEVLEEVRKKLPRTFVNLIPLFNISQVRRHMCVWGAGVSGRCWCVWVCGCMDGLLLHV